MAFWIAAAGIGLAVTALLLLALLRGRTEDAPAAAYDLRVYRDQLREVDRDLARGVIAPADAERLRTEVAGRQRFTMNGPRAHEATESIMQDYAPSKVSAAWNVFTYFNFAVGASMMAGGIYFLEASFAAKGFYAMAALMLVSSTAAITKTLRDNEESQRLYNKLDEARTERLLMEVSAQKTP